MLLTVNMLIQTVQGSEKTVERVLWINSDYSMAVVIDIHANKSTPTFKNVEDIMQLIEEGRATVLTEDPYSIFVTEKEISEKERLVRDKAWEIINVIARKESEPEIFDVKRRVELIKKASTNSGVSEKTIYKYLRRFWQRGKHKNALLPDYKNIGGKGLEKKNHR
ncbi:hypothetical protein [Aneurinibacillus tyrosinisolvens]|uniref:hypothetical protein n=1 Tax=Aneurinibacillus tyrosinisolvens TaxID=1443435 RepID=UPI000699AA26|nr:hypothetical protein [Aneurinibacillus tyrosinisolvens]